MTNWKGQPAIVIASGPSLGFDDYADVEIVRESGIKVVAVNTTWERVPFCDVLYAGDRCWWGHNEDKINIDAERWTCSKPAATLNGATYRPRKIKPGYNSGANAIELAANVFKANPVLMLGFDCSIKHGIHHHGAHKKSGNPNDRRCHMWKNQFKNLVKVCGDTRLINCSRYTEIKGVERMDLKKALEV